MKTNHTKPTRHSMLDVRSWMLNVALALLLASVGSATAATRYVWQSSPSPAPPYTNWATAACVIQDAVDAAVAGDVIVVTNGLYATGGRVVGTNVLVNRVAVTKPLTLRSVNGPQLTVIQGYQVPGTTNGDGAIRCVYLANGASLSGFTLTNGATRTVYDYPTYREGSGGGVWCESTYAMASNCVLVANSAHYQGGGAYRGTLKNCTLTANWASESGGGTYGGTLNNCTLTGNSASYSGGGAAQATLNNCTLTGNVANYSGGGAAGYYDQPCTLNNCTLTANAARIGGGAYHTTLNNCTLTGNSASELGGGAYQGTLNNCIIYFNAAAKGENWEYGVLNYCCTTPLPESWQGVGNISTDPALASSSHLSATSPCRGAGNAAYATGRDIDGEAWASPPSIGCDEYRAGAVSGPLSVGFEADYTNVTAGFTVNLTARIEGRTTISAWDFGDGLAVSNRPHANHTWTAPGDYAVVLRAFNESYPAGVSSTQMVRVVTQPAHYVAAESAHSLPPYTSWATAATNIQDAVDAATVAGALVQVSNGVYAAGGRAVSGTLTNRVAVYKPLTLRSINGPQFTVIDGNGEMRCAYLATRASLLGFTLTNGVADSGGGVWCESANAVVSNCVVVANSAASQGGGAYRGTLNHCTLTGNTAESGGAASGDYYSPCILNNCTLSRNAARSGGGAHYGTLNNCALAGNSAFQSGGGAYAGTLNNCTLTGNSAASSGGGADGSTLNNCIVYFNTAAQGANYSDSGLNYCCTTPLPVPRAWQEPFLGNITLDPQLASPSHLSVFSPCRGAGSAASATGTDIDGEPWGNPPSIGCDEYRAGTVTGPLTLSIEAAHTNVAVGFPVDLTAWIEGRPTLSVWDFDDGEFVLNQPWTAHAWTAPGVYLVALWAFNETHLEGVNTTVTIRVVPQPVHYVAHDSGHPVPPYTSWATAATNIQAAVDAATVPGALVLVSNGVYAIGGRAVVGSMTNRVAVDKPLTMRSVNGPEVTIIQGYQVPGTTNGDGAIRCAYLANGASLSGFTLINGATRGDQGNWPDEVSGGGLWCESSAVVSNCVLVGNAANYFGGGAYGGTLNNCLLSGNSAGSYGGGAYRGTLNNCMLTGNWARGGGGAAGGNLNNCTLTGNSAADRGGGATGGSWFTESCTLNNCTLTGNSAGQTGGGVSYGGWGAPCMVNNCIVYFNTAPDGANYSTLTTLNYCCTTPLPTDGVGNISLDPQLLDTAHVSASSPCRGAGSGAYTTGTDIDGEVWATPPSIGCDEYYAGVATGPLRVTLMTTFTNVPTGYPVGLAALIEGHASQSVWNFDDGLTLTNRPYTSHAWAVPGDYAVVLRAYNETNPGGVSATVTVHVVTQPVHYVSATSVNPVPPYNSWATAATNIQDAVDAADAASFPPGSLLVLVTNGVYASGGRAVVGTMTNRVAVDKPLTVRSVNGPQFTVIQGYQVPGTTTGDGAIRCVYLTNGASLSGFTLTNGATRIGGDWEREQYGGGLWAESSAVASNCIVAGNSAYWGGGGAFGGTLSDCKLATNSARFGGGAFEGTLFNCALISNSADEGGGACLSTLNNCTLTGNSADGPAHGSGGGVYAATLNNCTLIGNSARRFGGGVIWTEGEPGGLLNNCTLIGNSAGEGGGGISGGILNNCILYFNTAPSGPNYRSPYSRLNFSCTAPMPSIGVGNITNAPLFVDYAGSNLRLQSNSPCINAGNNSYLTNSNLTDCVDLDGLPRIVRGTVDMGAYEYQGPGSLISYAWLEQYGLPTDGSADYVDSDKDGHNNWQEWRCLTDPTNALSVLRLLTPSPAGTNVTVSWQSVAGVNYFLERGTNLASMPPFWPQATGLAGQAGTTSFTDTNAASLAPLFYRVGVWP